MIYGQINRCFFGFKLGVNLASGLRDHIDFRRKNSKLCWTLPSVLNITEKELWLHTQKLPRSGAAADVWSVTTYKSTFQEKPGANIYQNVIPDHVALNLCLSLSLNEENTAICTRSAAARESKDQKALTGRKLAVTQAVMTTSQRAPAASSIWTNKTRSFVGDWWFSKSSLANGAQKGWMHRVMWTVHARVEEFGRRREGEQQ